MGESCRGPPMLWGGRQVVCSGRPTEGKGARAGRGCGGSDSPSS